MGALKRTLYDKIIDFIIMIILGAYAVLCVLPFVYVIAASFTPPEAVSGEQFLFFPRKISLAAYRYIFSTSTLFDAFKVSVFVTVVGTVFNIFMTVIFAYPLSHNDIKGRRIILFLVTFTMLFSGGMIPNFILIKNLGLMNKLSALIIPGAINTFNFVIFRNHFHSLPAELEESAMIDGAGYYRILLQILLPVSTALIATFTVMYGVGHWNSWFAATLYLTDNRKWPLQVILRMVMDVSAGIGDSSEAVSTVSVPPQNVRMAVIVVISAPILMVYPCLQKYFTKDLLLGSVKG